MTLKSTVRAVLSRTFIVNTKRDLLESEQSSHVHVHTGQRICTRDGSISNGHVADYAKKAIIRSLVCDRPASSPRSNMYRMRSWLVDVAR